MNLLTLFILLNIFNVITQTIKSLATVKCGKTAAAVVNALAYGLYTIVIVYTNCELNLWAKVAVVSMANLIGVYVVKYIEEKMRKDKLWKIEFSIKNNVDNSVSAIHHALNAEDISHNYIDIGKYTIFNCFCATQAESKKVKKYIDECNAKYFASESKLL